MPKGELHVTLYVNYADDEKLTDVSRGARLLYVDALCLAKRMLNDGLLTEPQVAKLAYPETPAKAKRLAGELVDTGAWQWVDEKRSYFISSWLKRNKSRVEVEEDRRKAEDAAALGNHRRWHTEQSQPDCRYCAGGVTPPKSPPGSGTRSPTGSGTAKRVVSPETETETETEKKSASDDAAPKPDLGRTDVEQLCNRLADHVERNGAKRPTITAKWRDAARLLFDRDQRPVPEVVRVLDWSQADDFWRSNILSVPKFREKYDQLKLQMDRRAPGASRPDIAPLASGDEEWMR